MQNRLHRITEELSFFDAVVDSMNQLQVQLENLCAQVTNFDAFHKDVDLVDADLLVSFIPIVTPHWMFIEYDWNLILLLLFDAIYMI